MRQRGFSLVELLTVMAIVGILLTVSTMAFSRMQTNSMIESQVRTLQSDLLELRQQALYGKRPRSVVISGQSFSVYSSATITATPLRSKTLRFPMVWSSSGTLTFDSQGLTGGGGGPPRPLRHPHRQPEPTQFGIRRQPGDFRRADRRRHPDRRNLQQ